VFIIGVIYWDTWSANFYKYKSKAKHISVSWDDNLKIAGELKLREDDRLMYTKNVTYEKRFSFLNNEGHIMDR
jgi:hypothetical protein